MKTLFFRCNADNESGNGHFSRCLNIARNITLLENDIHIIFNGNYNEFAITQLKKYNVNYLIIEQEKQWDINYNCSLTKTCDYFILDTYLVDETFISGIKNDNCKLIVIDDFKQYDFSMVDLIVNFCIDAGNRFKYKNKNTALGLYFFPVKPELKEIRASRLNAQKKKSNKVLILMGGNDKLEIGPRLIKPILNILPDCCINIITNIDIRESYKNVNVCSFTSEIEKLYSTSDLVIHGGGLAKYESSYCIIPNISIALSDSIQADTSIFSEKKLCFNAGLADQYIDKTFIDTLATSASGDVFEKFRVSSISNFSTNSLNNLTDIILR